MPAKQHGQLLGDGSKLTSGKRIDTFLGRSSSEMSFCNLSSPADCSGSKRVGAEQWWAGGRRQRRPGASGEHPLLLHMSHLLDRLAVGSRCSILLLLLLQDRHRKSSAGASAGGGRQCVLEAARWAQPSYCATAAAVYAQAWRPQDRALFSSDSDRQVRPSRTLYLAPNTPTLTLKSLIMAGAA